MNDVPFCARIGVLHGIVVGFIFGLVQFEHGAFALSASDATAIAIALALVALAVSLFALVVLARYALRSLWWQTALNALIVSWFTVRALLAVGSSPWSALLGVIIGAIVGLLIGWLLCRLCYAKLASR